MSELTSIISAVVGAALAVGGGMVAKSWEGRREKKALAYALSGEIAAIIEIIERRQYQIHLTKAIARVKEINKAVIIQASISKNYFTIYESNAVKVGLLPRKSALRVANFYTTAKSLIEDVTTTNNAPADAPSSLQRLEEMNNILTHLISLGKDLARELATV